MTIDPAILQGFILGENMKYDLKLLSASFYNKYPSDTYPNILLKDLRPYIVIVVKIEDYNWAIPLRSHVKHNYCYRLKGSGKSSDSALDFTKAVIINASTDIEGEPVIDNNEYIDIDSSIEFIITKFRTFIANYIKMCNDSEYNPYAFERIEKYSTLKYFKRLLIR